MESKHTSSSPVSTSELNQMHKHLKATKETHQADSLEYDVTIAKKIADLYEKYDRDLKAIFEVSSLLIYTL
jgi:hypothetical protein